MLPVSAVTSGESRNAQVKSAGGNRKHIEQDSRAQELMVFGLTRYADHGMSVVHNNDCMNTEAKETLKYAILHPDCKLYSKWITLAA